MLDSTSIFFPLLDCVISAQILVTEETEASPSHLHSLMTLSLLLYAFLSQVGGDLPPGTLPQITLSFGPPPTRMTAQVSTLIQRPYSLCHTESFWFYMPGLLPLKTIHIKQCLPKFRRILNKLQSLWMNRLLALHSRAPNSVLCGW